MEADARQFLRQFLTQPLLQILNPDSGAALELHLQHRFLGAGTPKINRIDGVIGRLGAVSNVASPWSKFAPQSIQERQGA